MPSQFDDLPQEILGIIFFNVPHSCYASLRLVNTSWDARFRALVFKQIRITHNTHFPSLLSDMERSLSQTRHTSVKPIGHLVHSIKFLVGDGITGSELKQLALLCPNVTSLLTNYDLLKDIDCDEDGYTTRCECYDPYNSMADSFDQEEPESPSVSTFFASLELTRLSLMNASCFPLLVKVILPPLKQLVHLDICTPGGGGLSMNTMECHQMLMDPTDLLDYIQDSCPLLEHLYISKHYLTIAERVFYLSNVEVQPIHGFQETLASGCSKIRPWSSLTSLKLDITFEDGPKRNHWALPILIYLTVKFPHLQHLDLKSPYQVPRVFYQPITPGYQRLLTALLLGNYTFVNLRSIRINRIPLDPLAQFILFNHHNNSLESSSTLKKLDIGNCIELNYTPDYNSHHQNTFFQQHIFNNSITSLKLCDEGINFYTMLQCLDPALNSIETLSLATGHKNQGILPIDFILDQCPRLKHLQLSLLRLGQSSSSKPLTNQQQQQQQQHPLEELELERIKVETTDLFTLVSERCHRLTKLSLEDLGFRVSPPNTNEWIQPYWKTLIGQQGSLLKPNHVSWISMPNTRLASCALRDIYRWGHRFAYNHTSCLLIRASPSIHLNNTLEPALLYSTKDLDSYGKELDGIRCFDGKNAGQILNKLSSGQGHLDPDTDHCFTTIKKNGLMVFYCKDMKDIEFNCS